MLCTQLTKISVSCYIQCYSKHRTTNHPQLQAGTHRHSAPQVLARQHHPSLAYTFILHLLTVRLKVPPTPDSTLSHYKPLQLLKLTEHVRQNFKKKKRKSTNIINTQIFLKMNRWKKKNTFSLQLSPTSVLILFSQFSSKYAGSLQIRKS